MNPGEGDPSRKKPFDALSLALRYDIDEQRGRQPFFMATLRVIGQWALYSVQGCRTQPLSGTNGEPESIYGGRSIVITKHTSCFLL